ncbi:hypothetical protein GALMADRAFT_245194 [Galerina marginata CBS 339.88]|uniref:C2 domain-containing protein n=1 Tax=Galerina marginata (strain CBS 339.88) TaxID=685588 RepID=A0A067TGQ3_GALM3|nr:hypothetical protein GALMADRAFT_245194 [Galerina marginata CBS 339.88]
MSQHRRNSTRQTPTGTSESFFSLELTVKRLTGVKKGIIPAVGPRYYFVANFAGDPKPIVGNPVVAKGDTVSWNKTISSLTESQQPSILKIGVHKTQMIGPDIFLGGFDGNLAEQPEFLAMKEGDGMHVGLKMKNEPSLMLEFSVTKRRDTLFTLPREGTNDLMATSRR